jgi:hypothetical protein
MPIVSRKPRRLNAVRQPRFCVDAVRAKEPAEALLDPGAEGAIAGRDALENGEAKAATPIGKAGRFQRLRHRCFQGDVFKTYASFGTARGIDSFATDACAFLGHRTFHHKNDERHRKHQDSEQPKTVEIGK